MSVRKLSRIILGANMARSIAAQLEQNAEELIVSYYCPRAGKVTPAPIRREIDRCQRWAKLLRGGKVR